MPDAPPQKAPAGKQDVLKPVLRLFAAVVLGVIAANVVIFVTEIIGTSLHPMAPGANPKDHDAMVAWARALPASAFALVLFGWTFGAFIGGVVTGKIDRATWARSSLVAGAVILGGVVLNMKNLPQPPWMWVGAFVSIIPAAYIGGRTGATR